MATRDNDDGDNKRWEGCSQKGEKRCFDLFATLLLAYGDDETRARRSREEQERNMLMIRTITTAATNAFSLGKRKNQENIASSSSATSSSRSLVESKRRRVEEETNDDEPIRAEPIREIKPPVRKRKGPVKQQKEPVRREPGVTPEWLAELMRKKNGVEAKLVIEKVITKTDLKADQGRFLIPFKQIAEDDFLNGRDVAKGVDVLLLNSNDAEVDWKANLRIWKMRSTFNYALCSGWNLFVRQNDLAVGQTRRLWSFHDQDGTLFLAFSPIDPVQAAQDEAMALALVPVNPAASSSTMATVVTSEDPFVCEEANRRLLPKIPRRRRTPRVCVGIITRDSSSNLLEGGFDLNRTPPEECTDMAPHDLQAVQETHIRSTSQESFTETTPLDLQLRL